MTDHYATLGVAKNATPEDIKKAYRRLAAIHHPDKGGDTAAFQKVQAAYETLSDPEKKQQFDNPNPFGGGGFPGGGFSFHTQGFDINDIFGQMFGGNPHHGFRPQPPSYRTTVWVSLEQVYNGAEQMLQFQANGSIEVIKIQVPKGIENGATVRFDNLIKNSILLVDFRVHPHEKFERRGADLYTIYEIDVFDLITGTDFEFTTISGKNLSVTVKPGTQPGSTLRLAGNGLPVHNSPMFGDQMIVLKPFIPDIIDSRITDSILLSRK
jgi:DnaJ-class molecular chaperone